jgi:ketol-acid reductoisomerase
MAANIFDDDDADLGIAQGGTVAVVGHGSQGPLGRGDGMRG